MLLIVVKSICYMFICYCLLITFLDHFAFCLKCKRGCSLALNNVNGKFQADLLRSHYNYLQFAYYKRE